MNASEKLILIAKAISDEEMIEKRYRGETSQEWEKLKWNENYKSFIGASNWSIHELLNSCMEIRSIPKLPKLTDEEKEFLKWFPQDWWIARDRNGDIFIYEDKPSKGNAWWWSGEVKYKYPRELLPTIKITGIDWSDDDCYTIGELRK